MGKLELTVPNVKINVDVIEQVTEIVNSRISELEKNTQENYQFILSELDKYSVNENKVLDRIEFIDQRQLKLIESKLDNGLINGTILFAFCLSVLTNIGLLIYLLIS